jgi:hypothetical protein
MASYEVEERMLKAIKKFPVINQTPIRLTNARAKAI